MRLHRFTAYGNMKHTYCAAAGIIIKTICVFVTFVYGAVLLLPFCSLDNGMISNKVEFRERVSIEILQYMFCAPKRDRFSIALLHCQCAATLAVVFVFSWDTSNWYGNRKKAKHLFFSSVTLFLFPVVSLPLHSIFGKTVDGRSPKLSQVKLSYLVSFSS